MNELEKQKIKNEVKTKLKPELMRPLVIELGNIEGEIGRFLQKEITVEDCQNLYIYINTRCHNATQMACVEVRKGSNKIIGVFKGDIPCDACPFNIFCSCKYKNDWHISMLEISDRVMDMYRFRKEVTTDDVKYIQEKYNKMKGSNAQKKLLKLIDNWDKQ